MHVLTRVTSFSQACQLSPIEETFDSSPSFRRVNLHLGLSTTTTTTTAKKNSIEEASWWSSESPSPCNKFTFEKFDTWKLLASEAKELYQDQQQLLSEEEEAFDFDMTASWSSAATGKPQLSYAERLRKAKESSTIKAEGVFTSPSSNESTEPSIIPTPIQGQEKSNTHGTQAENPTSAIEARVNGSAHMNDLSTSKRAEGDVTTAKEKDNISKSDRNDNLTKSAPITNVWEARRQKLLEQQQKEEQQQSVMTEDLSPSKQNSVSNGLPTVLGHHSSSAQVAIQKESTARAPESSHQNNAWIKKPKVIEDSVKEETTPISNGTASKIKSPQLQQIKSPKVIRGDQKRSKEGTETKGKGAKSRPPSLGDEKVWPSPDVAASVKATTDDGKDRSSKSTASSNLTQTDIQSLDVELMNPSGGERQRHGKQWISIVPNITHTSPLPSSSSNTNSSGKKKGNKSASGSASAGENSVINSSSSLQKSNKKLDHRKSSSSPMYNDKLKEAQVKRGSIASPHMSEASFLGSPRIQSHATSPLLSRSNQIDESQENVQRSNLAAIVQNDLLLNANNKTPSADLRSFSANRGSTRGPRFSEDNRGSPNGSSSAWRGNSQDGDPSPKVFSQTPNREVSAEELASNFSNALHLSRSSNISSPILSQRQMGSESVGEASGAPTPGSITSTDSVLNADGKFIHRSRSMAPSPRGSRGRGGSSRRKASDDEDIPGDSGSSVKTDNEIRGLPKDVPSGPKQRISEANKSEIGVKNNYRNRQYINRDGLQYRMHSPPPPMPSLPYGVPTGMFFPPNQYYNAPNSFASTSPMPMPPMEKTPEEFAPDIESSDTEPSRALLNQLEFYFSHRNLEGDFYLRKSMNSQGFVPIDLIANFKKVRQMINNVDVVKKTLVYSKVLEMDSDQVMVRKTINWHLYTLIDGERPQINNVYQQQHHHHHQHQPSPPQQQQQQHQHQHQEAYNYLPQHNQYVAYPIPNLPFTPQPMMNSQIAPLSYAPPQYSYGPMIAHLPGVYPQNVFPSDQSNSAQKTSGYKEYEGDNDDDEVLGVVAAEGLGGALKM